MAHLGVFSLPHLGHLGPMAGLAHTLISRGHDVTFYGLPEFGPLVEARGLKFQPYGLNGLQHGTYTEQSRNLSTLAGRAATTASLQILIDQAQLFFEEAPGILETAGLDLMLVDQLDYPAATWATITRRPFVTLIPALLRNDEPGVPGFGPESWPMDPEAQVRDLAYKKGMREMLTPFLDYLTRIRQQAGLGPFSYDHLWSNLAQISHQPAEFEYPREQLPPCFHFTAPFARGDRRPPVPFPWEKLDGRPLIYAGFGTTQHRHRRLYEVVLEVAPRLDAQVVLSLGGAELDMLPSQIPANVIVVPFAPQLDILKKATLMITHAGMNATLECLSAGVPMVALPIAHDQPGVSARIVWTGTGVRIPAEGCEPVQLETMIREVWQNPSYRLAARRFQDLLAPRDGLGQAADIIEQVLRTGRPVLRQDPTTTRPSGNLPL